MFEKIFFTFLGTLLLASTLVVAFSITFFMTFNVPSLEYAVSCMHAYARKYILFVCVCVNDLSDLHFILHCEHI